MYKHVASFVRIAAVAVCVLFGASYAIAQAEIEESLRGISKVQVIVEDMSGPASEVFSEGELDRRIKKRLTDAGIGITADSKLDEAERGNFLYLNLGSIGTSGGVAFSLSLQFKQAVILLDGTRSYGAGTWEAGKIATSSTRQFREYAESLVDDLVKEFIIAYLKANKTVAR